MFPVGNSFFLPNPSLWQEECSSLASSSSSSQETPELALADPIWNISWTRTEIIVDSVVFKLSQNPFACRRGFTQFIKNLKIPPVFYFRLDERVCMPDDSYPEQPIRPMPFDLLPLLEYRNTLISEGKNTRGTEALINWVIQYYLPKEPIFFAMYDAQNQKIGVEEISIGDLMALYRFEERWAKNYGAYQSFQPQAVVYVPVETDSPSPKILAPLPQYPWVAPPCVFEDKGFGFQQYENVQQSLLSGIEEWRTNRNPKALEELASLVSIGEEVLIDCPPNDQECFMQLILEVNEILFQTEQKENEAPPLSPESAREQRRLEKMEES